MKVSDFAALSPEEVAELTGKDKTAYDKWLAKQLDATETEEEEIDETLEEKAQAFFKGNPQYPHKSINVVGDGSMFAPTLKGKNDMTNHVNTLPADKQKVIEIFKEA
jgi:hypothetical protein